VSAPRPKSHRVPRDEPQEWKERSEDARKARLNVGQQFTDLLVEADITGSSQLIAKRVREMVEAEGSGDRTMMRAAAMELAVAAGVYAAGIDLDHAD
jgi:hypothetical protein